MTDKEDLLNFLRAKDETLNCSTTQVEREERNLKENQKKINEKTAEPNVDDPNESEKLNSEETKKEVVKKDDYLKFFESEEPEIEEEVLEPGTMVLSENEDVRVDNVKNKPNFVFQFRREIESIKEQFDGTTLKFNRMLLSYKRTYSELINDIIDKIRDVLGQFTESENSLDFRVCVVGLSNSGKSTIINALIESNVLPTDLKCCTVIPVIVRHDPSVEYKQAFLHVRKKFVLGVKNTLEFLDNPIKFFSNQESHSGDDHVKSLKGRKGKMLFDNEFLEKLGIGTMQGMIEFIGRFLGRFTGEEERLTEKDMIRKFLMIANESLRVLLTHNNDESIKRISVLESVHGVDDLPVIVTRIPFCVETKEMLNYLPFNNFEIVDTPGTNEEVLGRYITRKLVETLKGKIHRLILIMSPSALGIEAESEFFQVYKELFSPEIISVVYNRLDEKLKNKARAIFSSNDPKYKESVSEIRKDFTDEINTRIFKGDRKEMKIKEEYVFPLSAEVGFMCLNWLRFIKNFGISDESLVPTYRIDNEEEDKEVVEKENIPEDDWSFLMGADVASSPMVKVEAKKEVDLGDDIDDFLDDLDREVEVKEKVDVEEVFNEDEDMEFLLDAKKTTEVKKKKRIEVIVTKMEGERDEKKQKKVKIVREKDENDEVLKHFFKSKKKVETKNEVFIGPALFRNVYQLFFELAKKNEEEFFKTTTVGDAKEVIMEKLKFSRIMEFRDKVIVSCMKGYYTSIIDYLTKLLLSYEKRVWDTYQQVKYMNEHLGKKYLNDSKGLTEICEEFKRIVDPYSEDNDSMSYYISEKFRKAKELYLERVNTFLQRCKGETFVIKEYTTVHSDRGIFEILMNKLYYWCLKYKNVKETKGKEFAMEKEIVLFIMSGKEGIYRRKNEKGIAEMKKIVMKVRDMLTKEVEKVTGEEIDYLQHIFKEQKAEILKHVSEVILPSVLTKREEGKESEVYGIQVKNIIGEDFGNLDFIGIEMKSKYLINLEEMKKTFNPYWLLLPVYGLGKFIANSITAPKIVYHFRMSKKKQKKKREDSFRDDLFKLCREACNILIKKFDEYEKRYSEGFQMIFKDIVGTLESVKKMSVERTKKIDAKKIKKAEGDFEVSLQKLKYKTSSMREHLIEGILKKM